MSAVIVWPETLGATATEVARIGSALRSANAAGTTRVSTVLAAASDEVSVQIANLFAAYGQDYQALSAQAAAYHRQFVQALITGAQSYATAEAAATGPLQGWIDTINASVLAATGRPLIGNGANGAPGTGAPGAPGGWLFGNGGADGRVPAG
ncbi:hypothetical protein A5640_02030 [Mycobacterium asiaticum]|uniref:PE domain-containing protein n=1 Tax=Mycobacterium asiaticum TaxID=1790 RepID=A0A1A3L087_MYCAS|nr:hypothetical protein A5640_02030 [Mycobacterium asiaticum]